MMIRILIVDDHPIVVSGMRAALSRESDLVVVASASTLAAARDRLAAETFDVVLLDLRLPDGSGATLIGEIAALRPAPAVLILSSFDAPPYVYAALQLGASGFLLKTEPIERIVKAIHECAEGRLAFTAEHLRAVRLAGWAPLSPRERSLIALLLEGRTNDEIGMRLGLTRKTVDTYFSRIYERFDVASRTELALRADREGWLDLPSVGKRSKGLIARGDAVRLPSAHGNERERSLTD